MISSRIRPRTMRCEIASTWSCVSRMAGRIAQRFQAFQNETPRRWSAAGLIDARPGRRRDPAPPERSVRQGLFGADAHRRRRFGHRRPPSGPLGRQALGVLLPGDQLAQPLLGLILDLTDALARHPKLRADLLQGEDAPALEREAVDDHGLFLVAQAAERHADDSLALALDELVLRVDRSPVDQVVRNRRVLVLADLLVQGQL